jgi:hypothetical protein
MITIGFSTRSDNQKYIDYLKKTSGLKNVEVIQKINNGEKSLSQTYNEILSESKNNIVVLCHDDIEFDTQQWGKRIIKHFTNSEFGILGVAGTTNMSESGMWWEDKSKMIGIVNHKHEGKKWESKYCKSWGDEITESCLVDGLFIALNKKNIVESFDESVSGFHFYDVHFCINNFLKGVKIGVIYNVRLTHLSIGQTNEKWEKNKLSFVEKYKEDLPINSNINLDYTNTKDFKFLKKYNLKIIINSGKNIEWVKKVLSKIKSFNIPNYEIILIANETLSDEIKTIEEINLKIYDGFFDELSKNLSILKWEDELIKKEDTLIFFIDNDVEIVNNIFSSISKLYHTESGNFGCAFPSTLNGDMTILSNEFNLFKNGEGQFGLMLKDSGSYYNLMIGYRQNKMGNLSDVFVTTYNNLVNNDWFDIQYDTNITFNDFAIKCVSKNQKCFIDGDSVTTQNTFNDNEKLNQDINKLIQVLMGNQKYQSLIQTVNG